MRLNVDMDKKWSVTLAICYASDLFLTKQEKGVLTFNYGQPFLIIIMKDFNACVKYDILPLVFIIWTQTFVFSISNSAILSISKQSHNIVNASYIQYLTYNRLFDLWRLLSPGKPRIIRTQKTLYMSLKWFLSSRGHLDLFFLSVKIFFQRWKYAGSKIFNLFWTSALSLMIMLSFQLCDAQNPSIFSWVILKSDPGWNHRNFFKRGTRQFLYINRRLKGRQ